MYHLRRCEVCKQFLGNKRSDAVTCSDVCRKRLSRQRDRLTRQGWQMLDWLQACAEYAQEGYHSNEAMAVLETVIEYARAVHAQVIMGLEITSVAEKSDHDNTSR